MTTAEELMTVVGLPVDSVAVRALVAADGLAASAEPDLAEGEPLRAYLSAPRAGYQIMHQSGRVVAAFMYAEPTEGFEAYSGLLPGGLPRRATRTEVRARFGIPERNAEAVTITGLGRQGAWDRFAIGRVRVHFQYSEPGELVCLVTVMAAAETP